MIILEELVKLLKKKIWNFTFFYGKCPNISNNEIANSVDIQNGL